MPHDDAIHQQASASGDYADEVLYDEGAVTVSLIHFADDSHSVRVELHDRGIGLVMDTPAWLDLEAVLSAVGAEEPTLGTGYAIVERQSDEGEVGYRVSVQGGDVVGRVSVILLEAELAQFRAALGATREQVESADALDHQAGRSGDGAV